MAMRLSIRKPTSMREEHSRGKSVNTVVQETSPQDLEAFCYIPKQIHHPRRHQTGRAGGRVMATKRKCSGSSYWMGGKKPQCNNPVVTTEWPYQCQECRASDERYEFACDKEIVSAKAHNQFFNRKKP